MDNKYKRKFAYDTLQDKRPGRNSDADEEAQVAYKSFNRTPADRAPQGSPEENLLAEIIVQAVSDATKQNLYEGIQGRRVHKTSFLQAKHFINENNNFFKEICSLINLCPQRTVRMVWSHPIAILNSREYLIT